MYTCNKCKKEWKNSSTIVQLVKTGMDGTTYTKPKYTVRLKKICPKGHYVKFLKQTDKVIEHVNAQLLAIEFVGED